MNLDSDSDLQAYINELSKKTQQFKYEGSSSDEISYALPATPAKAKNESIKTKVDKFHLLEKKYLKNKKDSQHADKLSKSAKRNKVSSQYTKSEISLDSDSSLSDSHNEEIKSTSPSTAHTDEILNLNNVISFNDIQLDSNIQNDQTSNDISKNFELKENNGQVRDSGHVANKTTEEFQDNESIFYANERKLSSGSLLMQRQGIFYSRSISTDKSKRKNSIPVFKDNVVWASESNKESSSSTNAKSNTPESVEEEISDHKSKSLRQSEKLKINNTHKSNDPKEEIMEDKKTINDNLKATSAVFSDKKDASPILSDKKDTSPVLNKKYAEPVLLNKIKGKTSRKSIKNKNETSEQSTSDVDSSSNSLSSTSSEIRRKKHHKKKNKNDEMMLDMMTKLMLKILPHISASFQERPLIHPYQSYLPPYVPYQSPQFTGGISSYTPAVTTAKIDYALKHTVELTRQFMETHKILHEAYLKTLLSNDKYSTLKDVEMFILKGSPSLSEARKLVDNQKKENKRKSKTKAS